ncbi:hypothetical protein MMC10_006595 [Thelotrema lepadinum]|nr:hypothetical protein [Thelotrema lepadinum]
MATTDTKNPQNEEHDTLAINPAQSKSPNSTLQTTPSFPPSLLLLSDSALPLGSFAFSSGLESYLAHHNHTHNHITSNKPSTSTSTSTSTSSSSSTSTSTPKPSILPFLSLSLSSLASTSLPYLLEAYHHPERILELDNDLDASTPCTVARRASVAQGRALLGVWERSFKGASTFPAPSARQASLPSNTAPAPSQNDAKDPPASGSVSASEAAEQALATFSSALKTATKNSDVPQPNGHFPPLFALLAASLSLSLSDTAYVFLHNHAKSILSAGVRAGVMGPYQAQSVLASGWLQGEIRGALESNWDIAVEEAGQGVPVVDLWVGRHEVVYSRIFNS